MGWALFFRNIGRGAAMVARQLTVTGWAIVAAMLSIVLLVATCAQQQAREADHARRAAEARAKALEDGRKADTAAADERVWDFKINQHREKELTDAVETLPDALPSPVQRRLACQRLRQQGARAEDLPADC